MLKTTKLAGSAFNTPWPSGESGILKVFVMSAVLWELESGSFVLASF